MLRGETLKLCPDVRMRMFRLEKRLVLRDSFRKKNSTKTEKRIGVEKYVFFKRNFQLKLPADKSSYFFTVHLHNWENF